MGETTDPDDAEPEIAELLAELAELEASVDSASERAQVRETMDAALRVTRPSVFGRVVRDFDRGDVAEALLGSVVFGVPMFVESGTLEIGDFLAGNPVFLGLTLAVTVGIVLGVLYVADIQDVRVTDPLFGLVPRRVVGVLGVSAVTAVALMTMWGRVTWADPWIATCRIAVAYFPMAIGAALGDLLPES